MPAIFSAAIIAIVSLRWSFMIPTIVIFFYAWFTVTQRRWIEEQQQQRVNNHSDNRSSPVVTFNENSKDNDNDNDLDVVIDVTSPPRGKWVRIKEGSGGDGGEATRDIGSSP